MTDQVIADPAVVDVSNVSKSYQRGTAVLNGIDLRIARGEMVALIGASGSGKSTLIRAIAGLMPIDRPRNGTAPAGQISVLGHPIQVRGRVDCSRSLRARVSVIFQQFNLVPRLSLLTNVCLGLLGSMPVAQGVIGRFTDTERRKAMRALARVGIAEHALRRASELSGGQQQRAAIARSLVQGAELLIADEPIASLDPASARRVMDLLADMNRTDGVTVFVSLHQVEYAMKYCPRTIALKHGVVAYDGPSSALTPAFLNQIYGAESEELFLPSFGETIGKAAVAMPEGAANGWHEVPVHAVDMPMPMAAKPVYSGIESLNA